MDPAPRKYRVGVIKRLICKTLFPFWHTPFGYVRFQRWGLGSFGYLLCISRHSA